MPATVVLVYDEQKTAKRFSDALSNAGHTVVVFSDPVDALRMFEGSRSADLLITRVRYSPDKPNGLALASRAKLRQPEIKVLFVAFPEMKSQVDDLGHFLAMPVSTADIVKAAKGLLER